MVKILISVGKIISQISRFLNLGNGSTWPGHIALILNKNFIRDTLTTSKIILIAGTNGKTTTGKLIKTILEKSGHRVFQNEAGANLLNGIASSLIQHSNLVGDIKQDFAIFEVDENTLPLALKEITPNYLILLNLFRDQLDRYGEVNTITKKWKAAIENLPTKTTLILNADDPQIAFLGKGYKGNVLYFGLNDPSLGVKTPQHAADSTFCSNCNQKLFYKTTYFSHLGDWKCTNCGLARPGLTEISPLFPLAGVYNRYNTLAATLTAKSIGINQKTTDSALQNFSPAFGRQEILKVNGKKVQLFLSKNPTSFNESLRTVKELNGKHLLLVLNDRIPDGRDVSWIWDVDFEQIDPHGSVSVAGDRVYDMALRLKYADILKQQVYTDLKQAISENLKNIKENETLYILPTYSAMLEVRKILTGKKIL